MKKTVNIRWALMLYDVIALLCCDLLLTAFSGKTVPAGNLALQYALSMVFILASRLAFRVYSQVWRYGGVKCYILLILADAAAFVPAFVIGLLVRTDGVNFVFPLALFTTNLLIGLVMRMTYRYAFRFGNNRTPFGRLMRLLLILFAGRNVLVTQPTVSTKTRVAIIGAGRVGTSLAAELMNNPDSQYEPVCFVDVSRNKIGREIQGLPVLPENDTTIEHLKDKNVQEIVFAMTGSDDEHKKQLYRRYYTSGYRVKVYDYPRVQNADGKRHLREFDIEELLFRKNVVMVDEKTSGYYSGKVILITGGGGSIGSEMCRQLAKMNPKQIILLDIYENGAYDVQQEIRIAYKGRVDVQIEIVSITNRKGLERVFERYHPQIVINAAAHKHVPLMERNCIEAVENNVFGCKNIVDCCEKYAAARFMMVSTDKAVNPTNVMGATKRMCEMIVQSAATAGKVHYSCTRFGNVLGSAGSVIPLFKKQIANGGPITLTDKRIIRYFMTIPEAAQLVLTSGAMAKNGELFVLDMGKPVKILDLAESMIQLSGVKNIEIVETGLRPGEKLYEELLVKTEELDKTENELIYIERDTAFSAEQIEDKLARLKAACGQDDDSVREALKQAVPTFKTPEEVNGAA